MIKMNKKLTITSQLIEQHSKHNKLTPVYYLFYKWEYYAMKAAPISQSLSIRLHNIQLTVFSSAPNPTSS